MFFRNRLFVPNGKAHARFRGFGIAAMAARSRAFGAGGCSSRLSTKRLSRSDSTTRSDSSIAALASRKAGCRTKLVRSVCLKAAARVSMAFCSGRSRRFIRWLSSTIFLGKRPPEVYSLKAYTLGGGKSIRVARPVGSTQLIDPMVNRGSWVVVRSHEFRVVGRRL